MIKTGRTVNALLGSGDEAKFNLLGGSFGQSGDVVSLYGGSGARFFPEAKDTILSARATGAAGGGGTGRSPRSTPWTTPTRQN